jgi:alpha-1,3-mannosyltransferase
MNLLLPLPAWLFIIAYENGTLPGLSALFLIVVTQFVIGWPFISHNASAYFETAFDFKRQFIYYWSVNFKFVPENIFNSNTFAIGLLLCHVTLLAYYLVKQLPKGLLKRLLNVKKLQGTIS